jgi:hypothetical protein
MKQSRMNIRVELQLGFGAIQCLPTEDKHILLNEFIHTHMIFDLCL